MATTYCGSCGAARTHPEQRFCVSCGAAHDPAPAPAPVAPVAPVAPPTARPLGQPSAYPPPAPPSPPGTPDYAVPRPPEEQPGRASGRRRGLATVVGVGALVLAVGGGSLVAWQVFGSEGGEGSPEQAAETFITALGDQDGVGLLSVLAPGEVAGLDDVYSAAIDRLEEEGLVEGAEISGAVDLEFADLGFEVEELGERVARVTLSSGTVTASYDPAELPDRLGFVAEDYPEARSETIDLAAEIDALTDDEYCADPECEVLEVEEGPFDLGLTTIEVDGSWYVSLLGTVADLEYQQLEAYGDLQAPRPDYDAVGEETDPIVGETPEEVVTQLVEAVNAGDVDDLLAQLPEDLGLGLRPYARTIQSFVDQAQAEGSWSFSVDDLDLQTEELDGDRLKVVVESADLGGSYEDVEYPEDGWSGSLSVNGPCAEVTDFSGGDVDGGCVPDALLDDLGFDEAYVVLTEVDGGYQLDPAATVASYAGTVIERLPDTMVDEILRAAETGDDSYFECYLDEYCE